MLFNTRIPRRPRTGSREDSSGPVFENARRQKRVEVFWNDERPLQARRCNELSLQNSRNAVPTTGPMAMFNRLADQRVVPTDQVRRNTPPGRFGLLVERLQPMLQPLAPIAVRLAESLQRQCQELLFSRG